MTVAAICSCQKSEVQSPDVDDSLEVVFTSGISTRATGTLWDEGDKLGVFMYESGESNIYTGSYNAEYSLTGGEGTSTANFSAEDPLYFIKNSKADFVAYYPYSESAEGGVLPVSTVDQSTEQKIKALDYMVARTTDCDETNGVTSLQFSRMMSKIVITVTRKETKIDAEISELAIKNIATGGSCSFTNSSSNSVVASTYTDISIFENESKQIEAIIIPQETSSATLYLIVDGEYRTASLANTFTAGKQYNYNLSIGSDEVEFEAGAITDWTETDNGELESVFVADIAYNTETSIYEIRSAKGLRAFSDLVNGNACSVSGLGVNDYFKLEFGTAYPSIKGKLIADIDLEGIDAEGNGVEGNEFSPIGVVGSFYEGTFDGDGYAISGLYINQPESDNIGLFGCVCGGSIKDLSVSGSVTGKDYVGVAGKIFGMASLTRCYSTLSVKGVNYVGGLVGYADQYCSVYYCYNEGTVSGSNDYVGGVVGCTYESTVTNCCNSGEVSGSYLASGIVAKSEGGKVSNCYNIGSISGGLSVGGIVGESSSSVTCCYNEGKVSGSMNSIGGIVGYSKATVSDCYNTGAVEGNSYVGGVVGHVSGSMVENCYNAGTVKYSNSFGVVFGGVVGYVSDEYAIKYCCYDVTVAGKIGAVYGSDNDPYYCGLTTEMMKGDAATEGTLLYYLTNSSYGASANWSADTGGINDGYPVLEWLVLE